MGTNRLPEISLPNFRKTGALILESKACQLGCSAVGFGSWCVAFWLSSKSGTRHEEQIQREIWKTTTLITNPCETEIVETLLHVKKVLRSLGWFETELMSTDFVKIELRVKIEELSISKNIFGLKWRTWSIKTFFACKSVQSKRVFNRFSSNPLRLAISFSICSSIDQEFGGKLCLFRQGTRYFLWSTFGPRE